MSFAGKVVIVTGSSSGIGQEAALIFAKNGASVTIHGQNLERLQTTQDLLKQAGVSDSKIHILQGAIEDESIQARLINETVQKFGRLDVLVNNAGTPRHPNLESNSLENFDFVMNANLRSVIALTYLAIPHLEKTKGNIVNVSSILSRRVALHAIPYSLTKAALDHFTHNAAILYAPKGIRINSVNPGVTATNFGTRHEMSADQLQKFYENYADTSIPMKRLGMAQEVANVIEFLASDKASYITGSNYDVDGGLSVGVPNHTAAKSEH